MDNEQLIEAIREVVRQELRATPQKFLTLQEASDLTRYSKRTIQNMVSEQRIPFIKPTDGKVLFVREQLEEWMMAKSSVPETTNRYAMGGKLISIK